MQATSRRLSGSSGRTILTLCIGKAEDTLTGDLDTQYVSLFARVSTGSWVNTFVGTLGRADVDPERTIPLSQDAGSIFFDVNADFNADEVGVNGSVGYRVNF